MSRSAWMILLFSAALGGCGTLKGMRHDAGTAVGWVGGGIVEIGGGIAGLGAAIEEPSPPAPAVPGAQGAAQGSCPPLPKYTPDQLKKGAAEMRALPKDSTLGLMVTDYGKVRDVCRLAPK